jgi:DNA invertase Pin-like site-specific DNA recombinase
LVELETRREGPKTTGLDVSSLMFHNRGIKYGYARVSTEDQNPALQLAALKRAGCQKVFKDERTGATTNRPSLLRCLKTLQDGDTLIVWKLDRLARSLRDLIAMLEDFNQRGIHFRSLTEEISTTTPGGKLVFHIFAALAEFESFRPRRSCCPIYWKSSRATTATGGRSKALFWNAIFPATPKAAQVRRLRTTFG